MAVGPRPNSQGQRKKGNLEWFTLFNRVNPEPMNGYSKKMLLCSVILLMLKWNDGLSAILN